MSAQPLNHLEMTTKQGEVIENSFITLKITDDINETNQMKEADESNQQNERNDIMDLTSEKLIDANTSPTPPPIKPRRKISKNEDAADLELQSSLLKYKKSNILPKAQSRGALTQSPDLHTTLTKATTANINKSRSKTTEPNTNQTKSVPSKIGSIRPYNYKQSAGGEIQVFDDNTNKKNHYTKHLNLKRHSGGEVEIFDEKAIYDVSSKIDSFNTNYRKTTNIVEVSTELDEVNELSLLNKKSLAKINDLKTKINQLKQQDTQKTPNINNKKPNIEDKDTLITKQSAGNRMAFNNKTIVGYQQNSSQPKKNKFDLFSVPNSDASERELKELNKPNTVNNSNQNSWREKGKSISKRAQSNTDSEKRRALKSVKKGEKAVSVYNKRNAKLFDDLGFVEPNLKNVKAKINSTWIVQENLPANNTQQAVSIRKTRKTYIESLKDRDEALSPKTKVKNWLVSSKPATPLSVNTDEILDKSQQTLAQLPQVVPHNQSKFPTIKKANYDLNSEFNANNFKKDPWLVDIPPDLMTGKQTRYESKLPHIHPKMIYELVNSLTNRKPVKVNENSYLFGFDEDEMNNLQEKAHSRSTYYYNNNNNSNNNNKNLETNEQYNPTPYDKTSNNSNNTKTRKFVVQISQTDSKTKRTLPNEKENLNEIKKEVELTDRSNPKLVEPIRSELDLNNTETSQQQNDQIIYQTVPLVLKVGQIPLSAVDNSQQFYMMKAKQPVFGNNLVQHHVSQTGRVDGNGQLNQLKPVVNFNQVPQVQPVYYYQQNPLPNILQNTLPTMTTPYSAGYVSVQPVPAVQPLPTVQTIPAIPAIPNAMQPTYQYVAAYSYPVQQVTPAATVPAHVPAQYVYYNQQSQLAQYQQHQPKLLPQPNLQSQKQLSASQDLYSSRSNQLQRATSVANLNAVPFNNIPVKIPKLALNQTERPELPYLEDTTNRQSSKPRLVEPLSLTSNTQQYEQPVIKSNLSKRSKNENIITSDKYKDLIYRPRYISSISTDKLKRNEFILEVKEEDEIEQELDEQESVKSSLPSIASQQKFSITTPLLSSRPVLMDTLKLPKPKMDFKEKTLTIDEINVVPRLMNDLKLPREKPNVETPKIKTPSPKPKVEEIIFKPPPKIQKDYHGKFVYPPEVEQQVEEDKDENENILNLISESSGEITEQETEFFYDRSKTTFIDRPKSVQANEVVVAESNETKERVQVNANQINEDYLNEEDHLTDLEIKRDPSEVSKMIEIDEDPNQNETNNFAQTNSIDLLQHVPKENFASEEEEFFEYEETKEAPELIRKKSSLTTEVIYSGEEVTSLVSERANYNSIQVMENVESEPQPTESRSFRPTSSRLTENIEENNVNLKANKNNPPLVNVADDEEEEHTHHDENDVNIDLHEANVKLSSAKKPRKHHFMFHSGGRNCCSAHRRHDPYYHIGSKVQSFENIAYQPSHPSFQMFEQHVKFEKKSKTDKARLKDDLKLISSQDNLRKLTENLINEDPIRIFSEHLNWHRLSKIGQISFENFHYRPEPSSVEIYNKKLQWVAESKISKFSNENINFSPTHSRISIFSERLKWKPKRIRSLSIDQANIEEEKMKLSPYKPYRMRAMSQIDFTMPLKSRILIFHDLPKWNEIVTAKVNSFENFHYRPVISNNKIYNEKIKWNSESKIKPLIYSDNYIPEHHEFNIPNYKLNWKALPRIDSRNLNIIKHYEENSANSAFYKIHSIRTDWYPGSKLDTFNINYKPYQKSTEKINFRSEPNLKSIEFYPIPEVSSKTPIFSEKLKWNSESKLRGISWDNFYYKKDAMQASQRRKKHNSYETDLIEPNKKKLPKIKSVSNKTNSWNREYVKFRKQEEIQRQKLIEFTKSKTLKRAKLRAEQQPDPERISNLKSLSRYKELPPIKSANNGSQTDRTTYSYESLGLKPTWNPNINYPNNSQNRLLNPDVKDNHLKRYLWDQELKRRSVADNYSNLSRYDAESMNQLNTSRDLNTTNRKDDSHLYGTEPLNDLKSRNNTPHRISTARSGRYSHRILDTPSTKLGMSLSHTPDSIAPRVIKKRSKNETDQKSLMMKEHDLKYPKFQPDTEGFEIQGSTLRVDTSTRVRPLANMSFKNAEDTARIRATSRLYSSIMTSRSQYLSNELENIMD